MPQAGDKSEFSFLDDPTNPLTLRFRHGIDGVAALDPDYARAFGPEPKGVSDKDVLQVIKISHRCAIAPEAGAGDGGAGARPATGTNAQPASGTGRMLEDALTKEKRADVYSIYFSFNSDAIREQSAEMLQEIATILTRHPDWKLLINGHTDGIGADQYNLELSRRRAAAVKRALVDSYGITATRLSSAGAGESQPKDRNDTLEGRARNRRVELIRQ